ncbi:ammonium transporter, Amt family [Sphingobacterium nematocida]|uniref:Ammonium transporter n=1 Tax=Sphingobacterium nematocida TaxID=1513896 RepID=A0A1T5GAM7_9SPHI|nr:ammonium transporter [Sphingobacterium nematocida]SKC05357.1 ammonium transporter, Amt family [Sphingobacterium nematocida]
MKKTIPFIVLIALAIIGMLGPSTEMANLSDVKLDSGDTAWLLTSSALVLIMTPGLAFFYGGMVSKKNVISTMLQSFICMCLISIVWVVFGFSLAFGEDIGGIIGDPRTFYMMKGMLGNVVWEGLPTVPLVLFAMFQLKFAIIAPALITGAFAERVRFNSYMVFILLFSIFIYMPLAHATWHPEGILARYGVLDFAGGTVVHMSAGWAALASAIYLKGRKAPTHSPARISYVILGTALLWFGWFGFNAGSAGGANSLAAHAFATTTIASAVAAMAWIFVDIIRGKKPSAMGACIGAVVGLVAITPAAGFVSISHSIVIGLVAALISNLLVFLRSKTRIDDTLDVFPCHGVGGMVGMVLTAVFAHSSINPVVKVNGLFFGETSLFIAHVVALVAVSIFAFFGSLLLIKLTDWIAPLRVHEKDEELGLDRTQHDEEL